MGDWMTVNITGSMTAGDAAELRRVLDRSGIDDAGVMDEDALKEWASYWEHPYACLSFNSRRPGLAGIGAWPAETVNRCGNLAERDYSVEDVAGALSALVRIAPSMLLKVHCGGPYESQTCVATISVGEGLVVTGAPERETVDGPSEGQILGNFITNLSRD